MRVSTLLQTHNLPRHELWALIEAATGQTREHWIAHDEEPLNPGAEALLTHWLNQRQQGRPLAYLLGWREFYSRRFWVNRHTLIPRPETELLVDIALREIRRRQQQEGLHATNLASRPVCELGTGSGCIAITLALECPGLQLVATDQSPDALRLARNNAAWLGADSCMTFRQGSWCHALEAPERFMGIVSNPPYIALDDPHLGQGDLAYEPIAALTDASPDGLESIRSIAEQAGAFLEPGGFLLVEHGHDQQPAVQALFRQAGLHDIAGLRDIAQVPRAVLGFKP